MALWAETRNDGPFVLKIIEQLIKVGHITRVAALDAEGHYGDDPRAPCGEYAKMLAKRKRSEKTETQRTGDKSLSFYYFQFSLIWQKKCSVVGVGTSEKSLPQGLFAKFAIRPFQLSR